jgi:predicted nucleotidyltransferase
MMTLESIEETLRRHKPELQRKFGVTRIGVFGSYARHEEDVESDVDILVELSEPIGWALIDLQVYLEAILDHKVDLVTIKALREELSATVMAEVVFA